MKALVKGNTTLITGGSGYLGGLIIESMLRETNSNLVVLARIGQELEKILEPVRIERLSRGEELSGEEVERVKLINYKDIDSLPEIESSLKKFGVNEIVHSAGCVEYFDVVELEKVNVDMTTNLLNLGNAINIERFIFISTAYSCGYIQSKASETLHSNPESDPTEYTRTKRAAEWLVVESGIPSVIIRPSIVIGNSKTGRYSGKRYGLYQQWMGLERLLCDRYHNEIHVVASKKPVNFLHQDSFQNGFSCIYNSLEQESSIIHLTSGTDTAPSMRDLWEMWLHEVAKPKRAFFYPSFSDVPLGSIHPRQRAYLMFASVNLEIGAHYWDFSNEKLMKLRSNGLEFADATLDSVSLCQDRFVSSSNRISKYLDKNSDKMCSTTEFIEVTEPLQCEAV